MGIQRKKERKDAFKEKKERRKNRKSGGIKGKGEGFKYSEGGGMIVTS